MGQIKTDWIDHTGDQCPVHPDVMIEVILRDGEEQSRALKAHEWDWTIDNSKNDIAKYRIVSQEQSKLKLEHGKTYNTREGKLVRITDRGHDVLYKFQGDNGNTYTSDGVVVYGHIGPFDCVSVVGDMPYMPELPTPSHTQNPKPARKKKSMSVPSPVTTQPPAVADALQNLLAALQQPPAIDEAKIIELVRKHSMATEIKLVTKDGEVVVPTGLHHHALPDVIKMLRSGVNVMMVGPAGSGKTTIAQQAAEALSLPFYFNGALSSEYKLTGFIDAQGRIVSTAFRKAYETGGVYLFDEIDASMPDALLAFNAALSNGHADFPDGTINRHVNFHCIAAANTFGRGADRVYVGRNQLDGASLDRFCVIDIDYDEKLERALAGNDNWVSYVQSVRKAVNKLKIRHVVSPRASISGARMLSLDMAKEFVQEAALFKGIDKDTRKKIVAEIDTEQDIPF